MSEFEAILILMIIRVALPLTFTLWVGESVKRQEAKNRYGHLVG